MRLELESEILLLEGLVILVSLSQLILNLSHVVSGLFKGRLVLHEVAESPRALLPALRHPGRLQRPSQMNLGSLRAAAKRELMLSIHKE